VKRTDLKRTDVQLAGVQLAGVRLSGVEGAKKKGTDVIVANYSRRPPVADH